MLIQSHASGLALDSEMRRTIDEKLSASFARFKDAIEKIQVHLADENGPKKGVDKSLRLAIHVEHQPVIIVEEKGEDWMALLCRVSDRAVHTLQRQTQRTREKRGRTSMAGKMLGPVELL